MDLDAPSLLTQYLHEEPKRFDGHVSEDACSGHLLRDRDSAGYRDAHENVRDVCLPCIVEQPLLC
ncbi:MAG: hypothetical protein ACOVS5_18965, partial [Oligoflexus sp.]